MANTIRITRSASTNTPTSLLQGEVANSELGSGNGVNELFIGTAGPTVFKLLQNNNGAPAQPTSGLTSATPVTADYMVFEDATDSLPKRVLYSAVPLSIFDNDTPFLTTYTETQTLDDVVTLGASTAVASTFSGGLNMADSDLSRPVLEDYGVKHQTPAISTNAVTVDLTLGNSATIDMDAATAAVTLTLSNPPASGTYGEVNLTIIMGTPAYGMTWPGTITWLNGGTSPILTTVDNTVDLVHLYTVDAGTTWYGTFAVAAAGASGNLAGLTDTTITSATDGALLLYDTGTSTWRDATMGTDATITDTGALTIAADAVTYAKMQNVVAANVFLGNAGGAGAIVDELTGTEATALLDDFATGATTSGLVPGSNSLGATYYIDGSGAWSVPPGGAASNSYVNHVVTDTDSGYTWAATGTAVAGSAADTLDWVSGLGVDIDVDATSDAIRVSADFDTLPTATAAGGDFLAFSDAGVSSKALISTTSVGLFDNTVTEYVSENDTMVVADWNWVLDEDAMGTDSAIHVATQQSVKAYVDNAVTGAMTHKGGYNATTNTPALDTGTPTLAIGDLYTVTVAGTFFTVAVEIGDTLISDVDSTDAAALSDWTIVQTNLGAASETVPGYIELATQAEMDTATDDARAVTPLKYANSTIDGGTF